MPKIKFSIITICYNLGAVIQSAVESVLSQSYDEVEYIIVDGGSSDGTVEWLKEISKEAEIKVVSESDNGLYDALNKGVRLATGDVIGFVHADDFLAHSEVLAHVAEKFKNSEVEAVYGDLQYVEGVATRRDRRLEDGRQKMLDETDYPSCTIQNSPFERSESIVRHWVSGEYSRKRLKWGWMPPHPTFYLKRDLYEQAILENGEYFDTSFTCAADYDFMMRVLSTLDVFPVYLPEVMVKMRVGGVSNRSLKHMLRKSAEDWRVIRSNKIGHLHTLVWKNLSKVIQFLPFLSKG